MPEQVENILQQLKKRYPLLSPKHCDNCGQLHHDHDLALISTTNGNFVFQISCSVCQLTQIVRLTPNGGLAIQRFEQNISDVRGHEFQKFAGKPSVEKNEALEVYESMKNVSSLDDFLQMIN